ncbi:ABC transporter ATP-binding protein [Magnetospira sp. QH-2]|uniref:ABC transporter ATP-binding protein n=1 Tax=Magnetospira sp. (strain QH-2) TaxID=1288970 RepID=UPI0003E810B9|nr:ABC transporter ATP-binding protein [Magnetospira sp. QH-2]CCQ74505.1 Sulfate/thiosulfate import ATP-binding protein cysA [Magnetospira sp. QH-2]
MMMTNAHEPAGVVIEDLNLSFGDTHVLKGVDLTISQGEFFAFLGPSGSGKSTLLRAIAGFGPTPSGRILIQGRDIAKLPPWKRDVGMVFQNYALWPHMTVRRNVAFGLEERRIARAEINSRVDRALDMVGLRDLADRRPSQLSGGQQQRIALARTIVVEPKVLLLDEPLSNLDANLRVQMRRDIRELQQKLELTTIFVTHDQEEANTTSDRMAVLDQGVIQQVGSPVQLYDNPANLFVAKFLGTANIIKGSVNQEGEALIFKTDKGMSIPLNQGTGKGRSIVFRPQNVDVQAEGSEVNDTYARIAGTVHHMEFLGSIIRYGVDVNDDMILIDHPHKLGEEVFGIGDNVDLLIDRESILVLSA